MTATAEERRLFVAEQLRSGQTIQAFSEERGIPYGRLRHWRLKLRRGEGKVSRFWTYALRARA